jgi:hypothetical protein
LSETGLRNFSFLAHSERLVDRELAVRRKDVIVSIQSNPSVGPAANRTRVIVCRRDIVNHAE